MTLAELYNEINKAVLSGGRRTTADNLRIVLKLISDFSAAQAFNDSSLVKLDGSRVQTLIQVANNGVIFTENIKATISFTVNGDIGIDGQGGLDIGFSSTSIVIGHVLAPLNLNGSVVNINGQAVSKYNYTATSDPSVNTDISTGYRAGSEIYNTTSGKLWKCVNNSLGAAVWLQIYPHISNGIAYNKSGDLLTFNGTDILIYN